MVINSNVCSHFFHFSLTMTGAISRNVGKIFSSLKSVADNLSFYLYSSQLRSHRRLEMKFYGTYVYTYIHNLRLRPTCIHICIPLKLLVTDTSQFSWVHGLKGYYQFYSLSLDADIVPCWSGTASEHWPSTLHWLTRLVYCGAKV